jgi:hypothetical protein
VRFLLNNPWLVFVTVCAALITSATVGHRVAWVTQVNEDSHQHEHITGLREGLFILLSLLLGFTVAMVLPRFDERTHLVVEESNAIATTMLRAETLPEPQRSRTVELLREYVIVRRDFASQTLLNRPALDRETQRTKALKRQLWQVMLTAVQQSPTVVVTTYLQSLNAMIDLAEKRLAEFENRVPTTVWLIIFVVAVFQSFTIGFSLKRRFWFSLVLTPMVVAIVMALVADLDSPHTGMIGIRQNSMERHNQRKTITQIFISLNSRDFLMRKHAGNDNEAVRCNALEPHEM